MGLDLFLLGLVAFFAALLTFFSGFGLGTLLLPAFALFVPLGAAVAATAVVHLANNLFKLALVGRHARWGIAVRFGAPAAVGAFAGASLLAVLTSLPPAFDYALAGRTFVVTPVKLAVAGLMAAFALVELSPRLSHAAIPAKYLPVGGLLSGFFGGLSGHQGALRSAFLARAGLDPTAFVGTNVVIACAVDVVRIAVYVPMLAHTRVWDGHAALIGTAVLAAFAGSFVGSRVLRKTTTTAIRALVAGMLGLLALGIGAGWI